INQKKKINNGHSHRHDVLRVRRAAAGGALAEGVAERAPPEELPLPARVDGRVDVELDGAGARSRAEEQDAHRQADGEREAPDRDAHGPLGGVEAAFGLESVRAELHDAELDHQRARHDGRKQPVPEDPPEDVVGPVGPPAVDLVGDVEQDERVEHGRADRRAERFAARGLRAGERHQVGEKRRPAVQERHAGGEEHGRLAEDHALHVPVDEGLLLRVYRRAGQELGLVGLVGGEGESAQGVHEKVDPEQLHGGEDGLAGRVDDRRHQGEQDGGDVDGELEHQELADALGHGTAPDERGHDGHEVVVQKDDRGGLLGDAGSRDAHGKTDVGRLEGRAVVSAVSRNRDGLAEALQVLDENLFVFGGGPGEDAEFREHPVERRQLAGGDMLPDAGTGRLVVVVVVGVGA
ncbi:MAG: hypothetical protein BJ554DRAFT_8288, partial [Olpidium bornovanus]